MMYNQPVITNSHGHNCLNPLARLPKKSDRCRVGTAPASGHRLWDARLGHGPENVGQLLRLQVQAVHLSTATSVQLRPEIPVISTYNPIYRMYSPIYNKL